MSVQFVVLAKAPVPGRVKTRLSPTYTAEEAAAIAELCLADTLEAVAATPSTRRVLVLEGRPGPWLPPGFEVISQRAGGLGARLEGAFADCFATCADPVVIIGMDTPQVTPTLLVATGLRLRHGVPPGRGRAVLGPADDGGYWAIGLDRPDPAVCSGVAMSRSDTCFEQRRQLERRGFDVAWSERLVDVDTPEALRLVVRSAPETRLAAWFRSRPSDAEESSLGGSPELA